MSHRIDYEDFCEDCGEYVDDCQCWLDERCPCCLEPNYRCVCDTEA